MVGQGVQDVIYLEPSHLSVQALALQAAIFGTKIWFGIYDGGGVGKRTVMHPERSDRRLTFSVFRGQGLCEMVLYDTGTLPPIVSELLPLPACL